MERVLIIEDDVLWQCKLQIIAEQAGLDVAPLAANLTEAEFVLQSEEIDLIIADIHFNGENVFDLFNNNAYKDIPTIFTTASEAREDYLRAKKLANYVFLVKPFHHHSLLSTIQLLKKSTATIINKSEKIGNLKISMTEIKSLYKLLGDEELIDIFGLKPRESTILKKRWQEEKTFKEIGEELKVSGARIQNLYPKILNRAKNKIISNLPRYKDYLNFVKTKKNKLEILKNSVEIHKELSKDFDTKTTIESIEEIHTKWKNVLWNKKIKTIGDLLQYSKKELLMFNKLGPFAVLTIEKALIEKGFELKD